MNIALEYAFDIQVKLIFALIALYNFIRLYSGQLDIFEESNGNSEEEDKANTLSNDEDTIYIKIEMDKLRDLIAINI